MKLTLLMFIKCLQYLVIYDIITYINNSSEVKVMKKEKFHIIIVFYIILAVFITTCLLSYNEYNYTEFGNIVLVTVDDETDNYSNKDLIIIPKNNKVMDNDKVFYYEEVNGKYKVRFGLVNGMGDSYVTINDKNVDKDMVIANNKKIKQLAGLGSILNFFESKWGYLCIIILPIFIAFIYEIYAIINVLKKEK